MRRINNNNKQSGQALVEYILILMIVVLISIGLLYQFNKSVRDYTNKFFGEYIACLIASGQLPSLGSADDTGCERPTLNFKASDLASGGGDGSGSSSSSSASSSLTDGSSSSVNNRSGLISASGGGSGGTTGGVGGGASGGGSSVPISDSDASKEDDNAFDDTGDGSGRSRRIDVSSDNADGNETERLGTGRLRSVPISAEESERGEKTAENTPLIATDQIGQTRLVPVAQSEGSRIGEEESDVSLDMAGFLKWLFIIGIIIAIVVLLFMQALQIKKGLEK